MDVVGEVVSLSGAAALTLYTRKIIQLMAEIKHLIIDDTECLAITFSESTIWTSPQALL